MSANRGEFAYYSDTLELTKKETKEILKTKNIYSRYIKRILDVLLSTIGLVVLSPVFLLIAILIKIGYTIKKYPFILPMTEPGLGGNANGKPYL